MEHLLINLQTLSSTLLGFNCLSDTPKTKVKVFKSLLPVTSLIIFIGFSFYGAFFDQTITFEEKLQILFILLATGGFLIIFISFLCNENQFQLLIKWVQARHTCRSIKLVNDVSNTAYGALSIRLWKIGR